MQAKKLRAPPATKVAERAAHECLKEVEGVLALRLAGVKPPQKPARGRPRKTVAPARNDNVAGLTSAQELLSFAVERGWVLP